VSRELRYDRLIQASPARVFDLFTSPAGQREFYGNDAPGWVVDSRCELRVGGVWEIAFGPLPGELYRHRHVFEAIERPSRLLLGTTETRLDGSRFAFSSEFTFARRDGATLMTMVQWGFPSDELRDEHGRAGRHAHRLGWIVDDDPAAQHAVPADDRSVRRAAARRVWSRADEHASCRPSGARPRRPGRCTPASAARHRRCADGAAGGTGTRRQRRGLASSHGRAR
jgi:uncharacterized protein YndB with AHSA1/START domain